MRLAALLLTSLLVACAPRVAEKPCVDPAPSSGARDPLPLPPSAFRDEERDRGPAPPTLAVPARRFETVTLRGDEAERARWTGKRIDLDIRLAPLHDVIRLLADVGNVNVVVGDGVDGQVTMRLVQVPWDQALDVVVRAKGFVATKEGDVIFVTKPKS